MLARWGKKKTLVKIHRMENKVAYLIEKPPGSGSFYLPLVENGKNVEEFEIVKERQLSLTGGDIAEQHGRDSIGIELMNIFSLGVFV